MQPSQRKSKNLQCLLREQEYIFVKNFLDLKGISLREFILSASHYNQHIKHKLNQEG